jgi:hypothetical protein
LNDQSICFVSIGANNQGIMVDSIQQIMILGMREVQIMLLPDHIDLCTDRMSHILNLKVRINYHLNSNKKLFCFLKDEETLPLKYEIPFHTNTKMIVSIMPSKEFRNDNIE